MDDGTIDTSGTTSATADASPDTSATSQIATPDGVQAAQTSPDASSATSEGGEAASSSATDTRVAQDAQTGAQNPSAAQRQADVDWKKRYDEIRRHHETQINPKLKQYEQQLKQYDGVDPHAVRQWREAQQRAQAEKLPRYSPQHPDHASFRKLREKLDWARDLIAKAPDDKRGEVKALVSQNFSEQEYAEIASWENYQREFSAHFASDPQGVIAGVAQQVARQAVEQVLQEREAVRRVEEWASRPESMALSEKYGDEAMKMMVEEGMTFARAREWMEMKAKLDALSNTAGHAAALQASASAQFNQRKAAAAISADPKADRQVDPKEVARQRGIHPSSPQYLDLLDELNSKGLLGSRA